MNNFEFYNPTRLVFGKGQIAKLKDLVPSKEKIMLCYGGGSIKSNGVYDQVIQALEGFQIVEFAGIQSNPQYDHLMQAVELAKKESATFLLAVGGGSVVDAVKFISAAIKADQDPWNFLAKREPVGEVIPFGAVLTLAATGSEMNCFSVVSRGEDKLGFGHPSLYPSFSILDPQTTFSLNERQLGNGIVDAFVHTTEQYLTKDINSPVQDRFAEGILKTLLEEGPKVIEVKEDYDSRANMMFAATMALNGLIGSGVVHDWSTHMIGHELTALFGIDHARTLALIHPSILRLNKESKKDKLNMFAVNVLGLKNENYEKRIDLAIDMIEDFFNRMGLPTKLKLYNITEDDFPKIIESVKKHHPYNLGEDRNIDEAKLKEILLMSL